MRLHPAPQAPLWLMAQAHACSTRLAERGAGCRLASGCPACPRALAGALAMPRARRCWPGRREACRASLGYFGGRAWVEDAPWKGLLLALGIAFAVAGGVEGVRWYLRAPGRRPPQPDGVTRRGTPANRVPGTRRTGTCGGPKLDSSGVPRPNVRPHGPRAGRQQRDVSLPECGPLDIAQDGDARRRFRSTAPTRTSRARRGTVTGWCRASCAGLTRMTSTGATPSSRRGP